MARSGQVVSIKIRPLTQVISACKAINRVQRRASSYSGACSMVPGSQAQNDSLWEGMGCTVVYECMRVDPRVQCQVSPSVVSPFEF